MEMIKTERALDAFKFQEVRKLTQIKGILAFQQRNIFKGKFGIEKSL